MATYQVLTAVYSGSIPSAPNPADNNPIVYVRIQRNGGPGNPGGYTAYVGIYWNQIQSAYQSGVSVLQQLFAANIDLHASQNAGIHANTPFPIMPTAANTPQPVTGQPQQPSTNGSLGDTVCTQAMTAGSW
jgi:hypothetical protein